MSYKIVILQGPDEIFNECAKEFGGAVRKGYCFLTRDEITARQEINPDESQLLIVDSFDGKKEKALDFVQEMKQINPRLLVWNYSMNDLYGPPYDHTVPTHDTHGLPMGSVLALLADMFLVDPEFTRLRR